jgi:asparagine synthetase A
MVERNKKMNEIQYKEIINRLEAIYETIWSLNNQEQLKEALNMFQECILKQYEVAESQQKLLKQIEKALNDEDDETENEILFS